VHEALSGKNEVKEDLNPPAFTVKRIAKGFEFGYGSISAGEEDPDTLVLLDKAIHPPGILVPVATQDDGCSDGRPAILIFKKQEIFKRSLHRAKVFGGAVVMTVASKIGLGDAHNRQLDEVFEDSIDTLVDKKVSFGAHTDEYAHGEDCGCGAIDRAPEALLAVLKYKDQIHTVITDLGVDPTGLDEVLDNFGQYIGGTLSQPKPYSGRQVMDRIIAADKVVKKLGGKHLERRILLNQVRGYTVNQKLIRLVTGGKAQVFGVDIWRLEDIAKKLYPDQPEKRHKAFLSELVYTLGTSAVLTKGDLPIDMIEPVSA